MQSILTTQWQDGDFFMGYLNDYPDYLTQGMSKAELQDNLKSLYADITSQQVPYIRRVEELVLA